MPAVAPRIATGEGSIIGADLVRKGGKLRRVDIDAQLSPEIGAIREEALGGRRALLGDIQADIGTLRGLENPFIQARTAPFVAGREQARRDAIRRGVAGPLTALATNPFEAQIADQAALAQFDVEQAIGQNRNLIRGLLQDISGEGQALLQQELQLLGLSQQEIRDIINSQLDPVVATQATSTGRTRPQILQPFGIGQASAGLGALFGG